MSVLEVAQSRLTIVPSGLRAASEFVGAEHRHHPPTRGHKFSVAVVDEADRRRGVAVAGRPVSRVLDGLGWLEVLRVATDGCPNACSALYGACARIGKEMGYLRHEIITYTLPDEPGTSLLAAGWVRDIITDGKSWDRPSRRRSDNAPTCRKQRWRAAAVPSGATS